MAEISCDLCVAPGSCCRAIPISLRIPFEITDRQEAEAYLVSHGAGMERHGPLFEALRPLTVPLELDGQPRMWFWACRALLPNGRCGTYETRPDMCKEFEAGSDCLCIHVRKADGSPAVPQRIAR